MNSPPTPAINLIDSRFHHNGLVPPPEIFRRAFDDYMDRRAYSPDSRGAIEARRALSASYAREGWDLDPDRFVLTAGTSEAYLLLFTQFATVDDEIVLPRPGYPLFEQIARQARLRIRYYDLRFDREWQPDVESLRAQWSPRTRFVVAISPNNPTGQTIDEALFREIARLCEERGAALICDEVFDDFVLDERKLVRPGQRFDRTCTLTLNGISKKFASPDFKLAWIAVSGPTDWANEAASILEIANDAYLLANSYSQFLLPRLFGELGDFRKRMVEAIKTNREALRSWLEAQTDFETILPRAGIHAVVRWKTAPADVDDEAFCRDLLRRENVEVHPGYFYDVQESGVWFVISLLKGSNEFCEALSRLSRFALR